MTEETIVKPKYRSVKLTTTMREEIAANVLKVFDSQNPAIDMQIIATKLWRYYLADTYGGTYSSMLRAMETHENAPDFIFTTKMIAVTRAGQCTISVPVEESVRGPSNKLKLEGYMLDWTLTKLFYERYKLVEARKAKRDATKSQTRTLLASVNTTKQLLESWPEIAKFVTPYLTGASSANLPVASTQDINKILGW